MPMRELMIPAIAESLPALIDRMTERLATARSSAEVLEVHKAAQAAVHLATVRGAAQENIGDGLRLVAACEIRLADEIDAAQARGELATAQAGRPLESVRAADTSPPATLTELGVARQRLAEWRDVRDAGPAAVDRSIVAAIAQGRVPTKAEILRDARSIKAERDERRRAQRFDRLVTISRGNTALPSATRYPVIYADPPRQYEHGSDQLAIENHYPTMPLGEICALDVAALATPDAALYLWATMPKLAEAMQVIEAWGFSYRTGVVWVKDRIGAGYYFRQRHELLLFAVRGQMPTPSTANRPDSVLDVPRTAHSEKPVEAYGLIERMYPSLPKIELFARTSRAGWASWGNQAEAASVGA
jgi:N6-adenosine-specific RNA methylase IME4